MKNSIAYYQIETPTQVLLLTSHNMTVINSTQKKIIGWGIMKVINYCMNQGYSIAKYFNVVCIDGHEKDPLEIKGYEEPPGIKQLRNKKRKK